MNEIPQTSPDAAPGDGEGGGSAERIFIVACRRSGTTWLTLLLAQQRGVLGVQQSSFFHRLDYLAKFFDEEVEYGRHILSQGENTAADAAEPRNGSDLQRQAVGGVIPAERAYHHLRPLAEEVYERLAGSASETLAVVDHQPENVRSWNRILEVFPEAWFVHVIRDPRAVYSSFLHSARTWAGPTDFPIDPPAFAMEWNREVAAGLAIREATKRYVEVRFEELRQGGAEELARIRRELSLSDDLEECRAAIEACSVDRLKKSDHGPKDFFRKGEVAGWRKELPRSAIEAVEYHCAELMDRLGYERELVTGSTPPLSVKLRTWRRSFRKWALGKG